MSVASENITNTQNLAQPREPEIATEAHAYKLLQFTISSTATPETPIKRQARLRESVMLDKIRQLAPDQLSKLDTVITSMIEENKARHNKAFINALNSLSDEPLRRIWNNPKDADYDNL